MNRQSLLGCVSDRHQFIILLIPKNASSTLRAECQQSALQCKEIISDDWTKEQQEEYKKYVFLRDPMERFLSGYKEVYNRFIGLDQYNAAKGIVTKNPLDFLSLQDTTESVYEFLEHIREQGFFNKHIQKQSDLLSGYTIDQFFLVERIDNGLNQIRQDLGLSPNTTLLPQHRQQRYIAKRKPFVHYQEELPDDLLASIRVLYQADFELYEKTAAAYAIL